MGEFRFIISPVDGVVIYCSRNCLSMGTSGATGNSRVYGLLDISRVNQLSSSIASLWLSVPNVTWNTEKKLFFKCHSSSVAGFRTLLHSLNQCIEFMTSYNVTRHCNWFMLLVWTPKNIEWLIGSFCILSGFTAILPCLSFALTVSLHAYISIDFQKHITYETWKRLETHDAMSSVRFLIEPPQRLASQLANWEWNYCKISLCFQTENFQLPSKIILYHKRSCCICQSFQLAISKLDACATSLKA